MKLKKVISGGQTGADRTGLECAKALGLETGGWAPRGFRTDIGNDPSLKEFGLTETASSDYPTRTKLNVRASDCTVWFGAATSPGGKLTLSLCLECNKPFSINPTATMMVTLADLYEVINVAGNRASKNPQVVKQVQDVFAALKT